MSQHIQVLFRMMVALLLVSATGCVTTNETVFTGEASPQKVMEQRVALARQYIGEGNWADAKRNLSIAYEIDPQAPEVHEAFALVYQSTGETELAEESFKRAISRRLPSRLIRWPELTV